MGCNSEASGGWDDDPDAVRDVREFVSVKNATVKDMKK